jgi:hypothetical protein
MNMRLIVEILTVYGLYLFGAAILIGRYGTRDRGPVIVVAWLMPALLVLSVLLSIFRLLFSRRLTVSRPPHGLEEAERFVEKHRHEMFGGELVKMHYATDWARLYARTLEEEAQKVKAFAKRILAYA